MDVGIDMTGNSEKRLSGRTAGIVALLVTTGGVVAANRDDVSRFLNMAPDRPPPRAPVHIPPLAPDGPVIVPRPPPFDPQVVHGTFTETPEWWGSFVEELIGIAPDVLDVAGDVADASDRVEKAMASARCTASEGGGVLTLPSYDQLRAAAEASLREYDVPESAIDPIASELEKRWFFLGNVRCN
jgi:hypothetical protein